MTRRASIRSRRRARLVAVGCVLVLGIGWSSARAAPAPPPGEAEAPAEVAAPEPANWRFKKHDRPVKLILVAGSIGAWPKQPYVKQIERMCSRVEAKNLSKVGQGAFALKQRFKQQVLENRYLPFHDDELEFWLAFQGGLNSVGMPEKTNRFIRDLFVLAHRRGMQVLGLSLTPWGDHKDKKRWVGANALHYKRATQKIVDFVVGRSSPDEALGVHVSRRADPSAPWSADELADVGIDLYDSPLRDPNAPATDIDEAKAQLRSDRRWMREHAELAPEVRERVLERDARELAEVQRWWLRPELRSFDHIHPNVEGHTAMANWMCPQLPASWGCTCAEAGSSVPARGSGGPRVETDPYF